MNKSTLLQVNMTQDSGGSRGGARGARPPLFWVKKEEMTEGRKAGRASKTKLPPPAPP